MASMPPDHQRRNTFTSYVAPSLNSYAAVGVDAAAAAEWCPPGPVRDVYQAQPRLLGGEVIAAQAPAYMCTQLNSNAEGIFGLLSVTNFKLAFVPLKNSDGDTAKLSQLQESYQENLFLQHNEVTLNNIDQIFQIPVESTSSGRAALSAVGVNSSKRNKLIDGPQQKLISGRLAGLHIVCKNFRMLKFSFPQQSSSSITGVRSNDGYKILQALAYVAFPTRHELSFAYTYDEKYFPTTRSGVTMYTTKNDWARELIRCGATEWQVVSAEALTKQPERTAGKTAPIHTLPSHFVIPKSCSVERFLDSSRAFCDSRGAFWVYSYGNGGAALIRMAELKSSEIRDTKLENVMLEWLRGNNEKRALKLLPLTDRMPSIQDIQRAFVKFRRLCTPEATQQFAMHDSKFLSLLEKSNWLFYVSLCLRYANEAAETLRSGSSCVLQESRGRDLCCVVASLTQLLLDPHFRSIDGFQSLIQKEWIALEHPFQTRLGHVRSTDSSSSSSSTSLLSSSLTATAFASPGASSAYSYSPPTTTGSNSQRSEVEPDGESPVFLLFLDCVWQLLQQFPDEFEFSQTYLTTLWDVCFVPLFDTFQFDCQAQRQRAVQKYNLILRPVWDWSEQFAEKDKCFFTNPLYQRQKQEAGVNAARRSMALPGNATPTILKPTAMLAATQRNTINPMLFTPQCSIPKDRFLQPQYSMSVLGIWEQCYYRWLPVLEIKHGGFPQIDLYHRVLLSNIVKLQRALDTEDFEDLPDCYYESMQQQVDNTGDIKSNTEFIDGVQRRIKPLVPALSSALNSAVAAGNLLPSISSFFPFSISAEDGSEAQQLNDIFSGSTEFQLDGSIMERISIA